MINHTKILLKTLFFPKCTCSPILSVLSCSPLQVDCVLDLPLFPCKTFESSKRVIVLQVLAPSRYDMRLSAYSDVSKFWYFLLSQKTDEVGFKDRLVSLVCLISLYIPLFFFSGIMFIFTYLVISSAEVIGPGGPSGFSNSSKFNFIESAFKLETSFSV